MMNLFDRKLLSMSLTALLVGLTVLVAPALGSTCTKVTPGGFNFWLDGPGTHRYQTANWWDQITLAYGQCFSSGDIDVHVNGQDVMQLYLYAKPDLQQMMDDRIRSWSGVEDARQATGTIDSCGWPVGVVVVRAEVDD